MVGDLSEGKSPFPYETSRKKLCGVFSFIGPHLFRRQEFVLKDMCPAAAFPRFHDLARRGGMERACGGGFRRRRG